MCAGLVSTAPRRVRRGSLFLLQRSRKRGYRLEQVADHGKNAGLGLSLIQRQERRLGVPIEGHDGRARAKVVEVLGRPADADRQQYARIDAYAGLTDLPVQREQVQFLRYFS